MRLTPYDPFGFLTRPFDRARNLFPAQIFQDDWFHQFMPVFQGGIRVDVRENANEVIVSAEIPGLEKKEDIKIVVHDDHLHLSGTILQAKEEKGENTFRSERYYGRFSRNVPLPSPVEEHGAKANYKNGILEIRLPKAKVESGRQIEVNFHE